MHSRSEWTLRIKEPKAAPPPPHPARRILPTSSTITHFHLREDGSDGNFFGVLAMLALLFSSHNKYSLQAKMHIKVGNGLNELR